MAKQRGARRSRRRVVWLFVLSVVVPIILFILSGFLPYGGRVSWVNIMGWAGFVAFLGLAGAGYYALRTQALGEAMSPAAGMRGLGLWLCVCIATSLILMLLVGYTDDVYTPGSENAVVLLAVVALPLVAAALDSRAGRTWPRRTWVPLTIGAVATWVVALTSVWARAQKGHVTTYYEVDRTLSILVNARGAMTAVVVAAAIWSVIALLVSYRKERRSRGTPSGR